MNDLRKVSEDCARSRNLRICIAKEIGRRGSSLNETYDIPEIMERFCFCERDVKYLLKTFFRSEGERYILNVTTQEFVKKALLAHQKALPLLGEAEVVFLKTFGRYCDQLEQTHYYKFDCCQLDSIYKDLHNVIYILHWGRLPIINKYLMINSGKIPENNVVDFYDHYHMLQAMLSDIRGEGEKMTTKGDETLDKEMTFSVYTRRWGHNDVYNIKRTVDGWNLESSTNGSVCEKDGTGALFNTLEHDSVFYPKEGVEFALKELWMQADEGALTLKELQDRLQQIADWISVVERSVGEGQPDWVAYY
jgi:hypothetical protein